VAETINGLYKTELIHKRGLGEQGNPWSWRPCNGSIGLTTSAYWSP
jgi:hypothetical protein